MVLKLYKNESGVLRYWEAWDESNAITVHWGVVGGKGTTKTLTVSPGENASSVVEREAAPLRLAGYREIENEELQQIAIQYPIVEMGTTEDLDKRSQVESLLNERLGWTGLGHCDGGDIGSGTMNIFCFVVDIDKATQHVVNELKAHDLVADMKVIEISEDGGRLLFPIASLKRAQ
jgi:predicted DNA-binding WGR domain protein